jgi:hypothetical protein
MWRTLVATLLVGQNSFAATPAANDISIQVPKNTTTNITLAGSDSDGDSLVYFVDGHYGEIKRGTSGHTVGAFPSALSPAPNSSGKGVLDGPSTSGTEVIPSEPLYINTNGSQTGFTFEGIYFWDYTSNWVNLFYIHSGSYKDVRLEASCGSSGHGFRFEFWDNNSGNSGRHAQHTRIADIDNVPCGNWIHLAASYDGGTDSNSMELYVNGEKILSTYSNPNNSIGTGAVLGLLVSGVPFINSQGDNTKILNAITDEVRVWDRKRSASEIKGAFNKELSGSEDGLVFYSRFNWEDRFTISDV